LFSLWIAGCAGRLDEPPAGERESGLLNRREAKTMSFTAALRDLNKLNTFVRVAQRRSFTNAAAELRTRPSVVSKRMKELEDDLGFRLINRSTHGLALTEAGEGLFQHCLQMLGELDDYVIERRNLETGPYGTLRVQVTSDFARAILAPLTARFVDKHPRIRVQLAVVPDNFTSAEDGVDVIVSSRKPAVPGVVGHDLGPIRHVICGSPRYFQKFGRPKAPQDLRGHNCLADPFSAAKAWPFRNAARPLLVEVKGSMSSNSAAVRVALALQHCGITRVPLHAVSGEIAARRLEVVFKASTLSPERMVAYVAKSKRLPAKTANFIDFLKSTLGR
jgi:DNA-binding transcriptional LysR family regulator